MSDRQSKTPVLGRGLIKGGDDILSRVLPQYHLRWQA